MRIFWSLVVPLTSANKEDTQVCCQNYSSVLTETWAENFPDPVTFSLNGLRNFLWLHQETKGKRKKERKKRFENMMLLLWRAELLPVKTNKTIRKKEKQPCLDFFARAAVCALKKHQNKTLIEGRTHCRDGGICWTAAERQHPITCTWINSGKRSSPLVRKRVSPQSHLISTERATGLLYTIARGQL